MSGKKVIFPMTYLELAILAGVAGFIGFGLGSGYASSLTDDCHAMAEQRTNSIYDQHVARAFEFAKCMSPRRYDPMYDYNRFHGK